MRLSWLAAVVMVGAGCGSVSYDPAPIGSSPGIELDGAQGSASLAEIRRAAQRQDYAGVAQLASALDPSTLAQWSDQERNEVWRLLGQAWLQLGDVQAAQSAIAQLTAREAEDYLLIAQVCETAEEHTCAADGYIQASIAYGYQHPALPVDVHDRIWRALTAARATDGQLGPAVFSHRYHQAWWQLQRNLRNAVSVQAHIDAWQSWRARNPSHPATLSPPAAFANYSQYRVPKVGVILPLSGQLASAGQAARDGFIAAVLAHNRAQPENFEAVFYDSAAQSLGVIAERIEQDGVDAVVGPLLKNNAEQFAAISPTLNRPVLLLNYVGDLSAPTRAGDPYQLGMAIEDEATSLSDHVLDRGHKKILIVHSEARWALR